MSGCRRKLPTLPGNRSPRNSISGECSAASALVSTGLQRNPGYNTSQQQPACASRTRDTYSQPNSVENMPQTSQKFGWVQLSFILEQSNVYVTVWSAKSLLMIEDIHTLSLPHPYVITRLYSLR